MNERLSHAQGAGGELDVMGRGRGRTEQGTPEMYTGCVEVIGREPSDEGGDPSR